MNGLTLSSLNLPLTSHPPQGANFSRNSQLVVDEDDLMSFTIKENCHELVNQFHRHFCSKTLGCRKIKSVLTP